MNEYLKYVKKGEKAELIIRTPQCAVRYFCKFEALNDDSIIISRPKNKHLEFNFPKGQNIEIYIYTQTGIYKLRCKLLSCAINQCRLTLPDDVQRMQRREYIRVDMNVKAIIKLQSPSGTKTIEANSRNISAKGINFYLKENIAPYLKIEVRLLFPEGPITTLARVVKANPVQTKTGTVFDTSLMFITIDEKEIDFIVKKCFEFEAIQRRKLLDIQQ